MALHPAHAFMASQFLDGLSHFKACFSQPEAISQAIQLDGSLAAVG